MPAVPATNSKAVADSVVAARPVPGQLNTTVPDERIRRLLGNTIAAFIRFRAERDPAAYSAWMRERGCVLVLDAEDSKPPYLLKREDAKCYHDAFSDYPIDPRFTAYEIFEKLFLLELDCMGESLLFPDSVVAGDGIAVMYRTVDESWSASPASGFIIEPNQELELWQGDSSMSGEPHWRPPIMLEEVFERDGEATLAAVLIATKTDEGRFAPLTVTLFYDPSSELWHIYFINISHFGLHPCGAGVF